MFPKFDNYYNLSSLSCKNRDDLSRINNINNKKEICEKLNPNQIFSYLFPTRSEPLSTFDIHKNKKQKWSYNTQKYGK